MREINDAFRLVAANAVVSKSEVGVAPSAATGRRLSREEIERMVAGIGTDGPVDWLFERVRWNRTDTAWVISWTTAFVATGFAHLSGIGDAYAALIFFCTLLCGFLVLLRALPRDQG
jgi:hypothetical protein